MNEREDFADELISAFLDGELSEDERRRVDQLLAGSSEHQQLFEELQALRAGMRGLPHYRLSSRFTERVVKLAEESQPVEVARAESRTPAFSGDASRRGLYWAAAAVAMALVVAGYLAATRNDDGNQIVDDSSVRQTPDISPNPLRGDLAAGDKQKSISSQPRQLPQPAVTADQPGDPAAGRNDTDRLPDSVARIARQQPVRIPDEPEKVRPAEPEAGSQTVGTELPPAFVENGPQPPIESPKLELLMVVEVAVQPSAAEKGVFAELLRMQGIAFNPSLNVDQRLSDALLASRFFAPERPPDRDKTRSTAAMQSEPSSTQLIFVSDAGHQLEAIFREIEARPLDFPAMMFDFTTQPAEIRLLEQLRRAAAAETEDANENTSAQGDRRGRAWQLALPENLQPKTMEPRRAKVDAIEDTTGDQRTESTLAPDQPAGRARRDDQPQAARTPEPFPAMPVPRMVVSGEVLFVLRTVKPN